MNEFICPNGRMSVNGVCPIFEGDDGQVKDIKKKNIFKFDFEEPTESTFEKADNIISKNISAYNSFVEDKLGISSNVQNVLRVGSAISGFANYGMVGAVAPFAIPFIAGAALNNQAQKQQEAAINRESVRDLQNRIDKGEFGSNTPTPQDTYRGGGQYTGGRSKSSSFDSAERGAALHG